MRSLYLGLLFLLLWGQPLREQLEGERLPVNGHQEHFCGFDGYERLLLQEDPALLSRQALLEKTEIPDRIKQTEPSCTPSRYIIPVVFHVIYSSSSDSISYDRIWGQVQRLFEDFRRVPETAGYAGAGADTEIEFSLATKDPNGNPTTGVVYWRYDQPPLNWSSPTFCRETQDLSMKVATAWDRTKYLNVWIVPRLCVASTGQTTCDPSNCGAVAGYAYFPSISLDRYGAVIGAQFFWGSTSGGGRDIRTTVHELGHNVNLYHPFQGSCGTSNCATSADGVCDTPPTYENNFSVRRQNTCNNDFPDLPDNPRNIMDYVSDANMTHFTAGQRARAWTAINNSSSRLYPLTRSANQNPTGTGPYGRVKAYFTAYPKVACVGQPVHFYSYSYGMPHIYNWDFGGGTSPDPTISCPTAVFSTPGTYTIRLIVENLSGRRDTLVKTNYITVYDTSLQAPYFEGFEGSTFPPQFSYIDNPDAARSGMTWEWFRGTTVPRGAFGRSATTMRLRFFSYSHYWEKDSWVSPSISLPTLASNTQAFIRFSYAYACLEYENSAISPPSYLLDYVDSLRVYVSTDCGANWSLLWDMGGRDLSTKAGGCVSVSGNISSSHQFLPTSSEWDSVTIDLSTYSGQTIKLRFEGVSGWGNTLYLDDIRVDTTSSNITALPTSSTIHMEAQLTPEQLTFKVDKALSFTHLSLYAISGQLIWQAGPLSLEAGTHKWAFEQPLPAGLYLLRCETPAGPRLFKLLP